LILVIAQVVERFIGNSVISNGHSFLQFLTGRQAVSDRNREIPLRCLTDSVGPDRKGEVRPVEFACRQFLPHLLKLFGPSAVPYYRPQRSRADQHPIIQVRLIRKAGNPQ
jgi:hypothetical protein